jgi:hypothetical protein
MTTRPLRASQDENIEEQARPLLLIYAQSLKVIQSGALSVGCAQRSHGIASTVHPVRFDRHVVPSRRHSFPERCIVLPTVLLSRALRS